MKKSSTFPPPPLSKLSSRIRHARARAELTKTELARRVGVCTSAVVQWEHPGGTAPTARNLAGIAAATDVAYEWLATGRGPSRVATDDGPPAIDPRSIAITIFEERLLEIVRQLPTHTQEPLIEFLAAWTKKHKTQRI